VDQPRLPEVPISPSGMGATAPRPGVEARLAEIWCAVLGRSTIGSTDNFFDLGGHSLSAARLLVRIEREFGRRLPIVAVFEAPTVRQMAALIDGDRSWSNTFFVPIQPGGSRRPLLAVGGGSYLRPLAARLGPDQPVFGVWLDSSELQGLPRPYTVTDLASRLATRLLAQRPITDYALSGWCLEGLLAYETARLLAAAGEPAPLVVLFDPPDPEALPLLAQPVHAAALVGRLGFHLKQLSRQQYQDVPGYLGARARWLWQRARLAALLVRDESRGVDHAGAAASIGDALYLAASRYRPQPYAGRVLLIGSQDLHGDRWEDTHRRWAALAGQRFMSHLAEGDHSSLFEEPHVVGVATRLRAALSPAEDP
jgi:thioesterase domain-containing protein/acyl carrier protein